MQIFIRDNIVTVSGTLTYKDVLQFINFSKQFDDKKAKKGGIFLDLFLREITLPAYVLLQLHFLYKRYYLVSFYHVQGNKKTFIFAKNSEEVYQDFLPMEDGESTPDAL